MVFCGSECCCVQNTYVRTYCVNADLHGCAMAMARRLRCFDVSTGENFANAPVGQLALGLVAVAPNTCRARRKQCYCCRKKVGFPSVLPHVCSQLLYGIFWPLPEICLIRVASDFSMNEGRFRGLRRAPCCRSFGSGKTTSRRLGASPRLSDSRGLTSRQSNR